LGSGDWEADGGKRKDEPGQTDRQKETGTGGRTDGRRARETDRGGGRTIAFNVFRKNFSLRFRCIFCAKGNCRRVTDGTEAVLLTINYEIKPNQINLLKII